jgi:hypothetical protein
MVNMSGYWDEDIFRCSGGTGSPNHVVVLTGYDDAGGYWIAKNSWGNQWNQDGYFKVGFLGSYGLQARLDDNRAIYCTSDHPEGEKIYRARFYFDPNSIRMAEGDVHQIFQGWGSGAQVLRGEFRRSAGRYQVRMGLLTDAGAWKYISWLTLSDTKHYLEFSWRAATSPAKNNGRLALWLDSGSKASLSGIDNDTRRIDRVRLGALAGIDTGTRGRYFFDEFVSRRIDQPIGP